MLIENSDEPYAAEIAATVAAWQKAGKPIETTTQMRQVIEESLCFLPQKERKDAVKKSCQRVFQALRIDVNCEFEVLYAFLDKLPQVLAPNGRVAILTFHSGEDRLVKQAFKQFFRDGTFSEISRDVLRPTAMNASAIPGQDPPRCAGPSAAQSDDPQTAVGFCRNRNIIQINR